MTSSDQVVRVLLKFLFIVGKKEYYRIPFLSNLIFFK